MAAWSGWIAVALLCAAALVPLVQRLRHGVRAAPRSRSVATHELLGMGATVAGCLHPLMALFYLGSPEAIGAGELALGLGALAFVLLIAHAGRGLRLRDPKLADRPKARRAHLTTAVAIAVAIGAHAAACLLAR
ncbi:MAG: hypothetical protein IT373_02990 [Polyangiaceae bacterium]|nr:hypothetical protein [Polyangiaceae bacterium]